MEITNLQLNRIDFDRTSFDLGFCRSYKKLRLSIEQAGVLQPVIARQCEPGGRTEIVCGFGRARVAKELGIESLSARLIKPDTTGADCLRLALFDNLGHREFNPIERAKVLVRFEPHVDRDRLIADYLPLLGMAPSGTLFDRTVRLLSLIEPLQIAVAEGRIEEKVGLLMTRFAAGDQEAFAGFLRSCGPSVSVARELAETLSDLARRDEQTPAELLATPKIKTLLDSSELKPAERISALRQQIRELRYPNLSEHERKFADAREALRLPPSMKLDASPAFESDELRLEVRFKTPAELRQSYEKIAAWFDDPSLLAGLWPGR